MIKLINENVAGPANSRDVSKPVMLSNDIVKLLQERLGDEYAAHYYYNSASNWCKNVGYLKATKFFEDESKDELEHARMLQDYLIDWNVTPVIPKVDTHKDFSDLVDIINGAYRIEYELFQKYNQNSQVIFSIELSTFDFLKNFRDIQNKSVAEYSDLLNALQLIDVNSRLDIIHFEEYYLGK